MALRVAVDAQDAGAVVGEKFAAEGTVLLPGLLVIAGFEIEPGEIRTRGLDRRTQSPVSQREGRAWFYFCVGLGGIPGGFIYIMVGEDILWLARSRVAEARLLLSRPSRTEKNGRPAENSVQDKKKTSRAQYFNELQRNRAGARISCMSSVGNPNPTVSSNRYSTCN